MKKLVTLFLLVLLFSPFFKWFLNYELDTILAARVPEIVVVKDTVIVTVREAEEGISEVLGTTTTLATTTKSVKKAFPVKTAVKQKSVDASAKTVEKPRPPVAPHVAEITNPSSQLEQLVIGEMNKERTKRGLAALRLDTDLASVARNHSSDMLSKDYFSHVSINGCTTECRIKKAGYVWESYGENLQWMSGQNLSIEGMAEKITSGWMASGGHRENVLNPDFTHVGVGVVKEGDKYYTTADYSLPG